MARHFPSLTLLAGLLLAWPGSGHAQEAGRAKKLTSDELAVWIDEHFATEWVAAGIEPGKVVNDATFLRRVFLDLTGSIPSVAQARDFLEYAGEHNRTVLIERLLNEKIRPDRFEDRTAAHWATLWRRMMVPGNTLAAQHAVALEPWLKQQFATNVPYDEFARRILTATSTTGAAMPATGSTSVAATATPVAFYTAVGGKPETAASAVSRIFLGTRIGCAECHDHPFAAWKQKDFWGMAAFFGGVRNGAVNDVATPRITPPNSTVEYAATFLGGAEVRLTAGVTPRQALAEWMVAPENKQFAATAVNRVWLYLLGRGLTESVDDLDVASPGERKLLDELAALFVASGHDLRWLMAGICKSQLYQRECAATAASVGVRIIKTQTPEQIFDSLEQALALPRARTEGSPRFNGLRAQLLARMNEAASNNPGDYRAGIPQALLLMNGRLTEEATDLDKSRTLRGVVDAPFLSSEDKLDTLYIATLTRKPRPDERAFLMSHIQKQPDDQRRNEAYGEILWGLLNSPEFVLVR